MIRAVATLALVAALTGPAYADEATVHKGEQVVILDAAGKARKRITATDAALFVIERDTAVSCNVAHRRVSTLSAALVASTQAAARLAQPEPGWQIAARWAFWGLTVTAAFAAGAYLF